MKIKDTHRALYPMMNGRIYDADKNCLTPQFKNNRGYLKINIRKGKQEYVHRIIAQAFIPNPDNLPCINHKDGDKTNNCVSNLEWCTYAENNQHAHNNGLMPKQDKTGIKNGNNKLNELQVRIIRRLRNDHKESVKYIQDLFSVGTTTVYEIASKKRWAHL